MAEELTEAQLAQDRAVVLAAIAAAGPAGNNYASWKGRVNALIPEVAVTIEARSLQMHRAALMREARVYSGAYQGYELEESSQRLVVFTLGEPTKRSPDGIDKIRTEPVYRAAGKRMRAQLDDLDVGTQVRVWRGMEEIRSGEHAGEKSRLLMRIEVVPDFDKNAQQADRGGTPSAPVQAAEPGPAGGSTEPPHSAPAGPNLVDPLETFKAEATRLGLTKGQKTAVKQRLEDDGLWPITIDTLDAGLVALRFEAAE
jgi:hypothetical protein